MTRANLERQAHQFLQHEHDRLKAIRALLIQQKEQNDATTSVLVQHLAQKRAVEEDKVGVEDNNGDDGGANDDLRDLIEDALHGDHHDAHANALEQHPLNHDKQMQDVVHDAEMSSAPQQHVVQHMHQQQQSHQPNNS
jgi:predicted transcriptional regulator